MPGGKKVTKLVKKLLNWKWIKYALWCEYIHCEPKKPSPRLNLLQFFESLKYNYRILDAYTSINFKQSVEVLLKSME